MTSNMELDVTKKVRTAIKAKLLELGVHVDDELPDYIMILIANRRTKVQMEEDLGLFLGDNTMKFSNWLHQVLKKLEEVTTGGGTGGEKPVPSSTSTTSVAAVKKSVDVTSTSSSVSKEKDGSDKKQVVQPTSSVKVKDSKIADLPSSNKKRKSDVSKDESDLDETASKSPSSKKLKISRKKVDSVQSNSDHEKSASAVVSSSSKRSPLVDRSKSRSKSPPSPPSNSNENFKSRTRSRSPIKFNRLESSVVVTTKSDKLPKIASVLSKKPPLPIKLRSRSPVTGPRRSPIRAAAPSRRSDRDRDRDRDRSFSPPTSSSLGQRKRHGGLELPSRSTHRGSLLSRIRRSRTRSRSRSGSPTSKARNTLRSLVAVVKRERHGDSNAAKEEEYNPLRPEVGSSSSAGELSGGVASVVHVTPRPKRATKQEERGSNKLLFRALADAQKSIVSHSMSSSKAVTSASADSKDKEAATPSDKSDIRKDRDRDAHLSSQNQQQSRASLPRRSHQQNVQDARDRDRDRESRRLKKPEGSSKPSVKDRLGFRLGKKVESSRDDNVSSSFRDYSDDEDDLRDGDFIEGSEDYKTIKISVPTSKTAKERNVTLEYAEEKAASSRQTSSSKPAPVSYEEPKRLSIQVNVDSDTSSSEDELEIQPRTTEDLNLDRLNDDRDDSSEKSSKKNLKPNSNAKISIEDKLKGRLESKPRSRSKNGSSSDEPKSSNKSNEDAKNSVVDSKVSQAKKADSSASDSEETEPDQDKKEGDKAEQRESDEPQKKIEPTEETEDADDGTGSEASENKAEGPRTDSRSDEDADADDARGSDDDHEEIEIEEYEEIEEEEDDEEYDVVIQERNISLPDPDGYEGKKATTETMDVGGEASTSAGGGQMDVSDGHDNERKLEDSMYFANSSHQHHPDSVQMGDGNGMVMVTSGGGRYPLHLRTDNHSAYDTRFVVTMEGAEDMDSMTYYEEESMETEGGESYSQPSMDLRQRITRSFAQNQSLESIINAKSVRPAGSFHHQGGRGVYDGSRKSSGNSRSYLPITGGHIRPPPPVQIHNQAQSSSVSSSALLSGSGSSNVIGSGGGSGGGPSCKYWPDCSFKDKCIYPHPPCKFGDKCTKPECPYKHELFHQSEVGGGGSGSGKIGGGVSSGGPNGGSGGIENDGKAICKFFPKCHSMSCQFYHPSPCRFGVGCTDVKCKNYHPGVTVAEQRSKNKLFGSVTRSSYNRAVPPAAHLLRWKAPSVGSASSGGGAPADSSLDSVSVSADMKVSDLLAAPVPTTSTA